jgi:hypothetical protein
VSISGRQGKEHGTVPAPEPYLRGRTEVCHAHKHFTGEMEKRKEDSIITRGMGMKIKYLSHSRFAGRQLHLHAYLNSHVGVSDSPIDF